jgi:tRNA(Arg) A34 adenosine deaminase TadA
MCAGTIYWANIGRVIYAAREEKLAELTGFDNAENFTMSLSCREVLARGQKDIKVGGPHEEWEDIVVNSSDEYWKPRREQAAKEVHPGTQGPIIWNISSD